MKEKTEREEKIDVDKEKESYEKPTLDKHEKLKDITEGYGSPAPVST
jgi:hypothetical protein